MPTIDEALQLGWRQHQAGELRQAEHVYRQVLQVAPTNANAWCFLGMACHDQQRYDEAVTAYRQALRIQPDFPIALSNLGNTLKQQGRLEEAEASCRAALRLKPDYATAYNNLGVALVAQGRLVEAAATFEKALSCMPNDAVAHANLSAALVRQGKYSEAEANARRALAINPNYAEAHKNQGIVWLLLGDFARGWREYEWRWRCPGYALPRYPQPLWEGSPLEGKTILLHHEQGLGDTIQFVRYARVLKERGARVVCKVQRPLLQLMARCGDIDQLVSDEAELPPFDFYVPMLSVPGILNTTFETIPGEVPYLAPDESLVRQWRQRLRDDRGFKVAIAWQGSRDFHADLQRSIPLKQFAPLAAVAGVRLISLQKGYGAEQIAGLESTFEVVHFGDALDASGAFMDTAAILKNVDLAILCDTSVTHLAGALAVPTWVALSISPDWRWFLDREDSPWYPTVRLFRQTRLGDWRDVFERLAHELRQRVEVRTTPDVRPKETPLQAAERQGGRRMTPEPTITVEIAPGELIDRITILEIKSERMTDPAKLTNVRLERSTLEEARDQAIEACPELEELAAELKAINEKLWDIEDQIRECEREKDFGQGFIELARAVYKTNDRRAAVKREINVLLGSRLVEEKSYRDYE